MVPVSSLYAEIAVEFVVDTSSDTTVIQAYKKKLNGCI